MNQYERLKSVIERDHLRSKNSADRLLRYDLETVLKDYFNLKGAADIKVITLDSGYKIQINCTATSIKPSGVTPV